MDMLRELLQEGKRRRTAPGDRVKLPSGKKVTIADENKDKVPQNYVAKHSAAKSGAGAHEVKNGKKSSRNRQKKDWKTDAGY